MRLTLPSILRGNVLAHPAYEKQYINLCGIKGVSSFMALVHAEKQRIGTIRSLLKQRTNAVGTALLTSVAPLPKNMLHS